MALAKGRWVPTIVEMTPTMMTMRPRVAMKRMMKMVRQRRATKRRQWEVLVKVKNAVVMAKTTGTATKAALVREASEGA